MKFLKIPTSFFSVFEFFLCLFVFLLPWQTIWIIQESFLSGFKFDYETIGIYVTEVLLWGLICIAFFSWKLKNKEEGNIFRRIERNEKKILVCVGLFLLYALCSVLWSSNKMIAGVHAFRMFEAIALLFFIFFSKVEGKKILQWFVAGSTLQSVLGLYQFFTQSTFSFKWLGLVSHPLFETGTSVVQSQEIGRWLRAYGAFPHPNIFAGYLVVGLVCISFLFLFFQKKRQYWFLLCLWLIHIMALFFTFSRSAWLSGLIFIGILFAWGIYAKKKYPAFNFAKNALVLFISSLVLIGGMVSVYFPLIKTRTQAQSFHEMRSVEERKSAFAQGLDIFSDYAVFGVGAGNYTIALKQEQGVASGQALQPVHNVFLLFLCELGIIGMFIFFLHIPFCFKQNKNIKLIFVVLLGILAPLLMFDHYFYSLNIGILLFAFLLGVAKKIFSTVYPQNLH